MPDYSRLVKAYDIRGEVPVQLNADLARRIGALFVRLTDAPRIVVARDMRDSSPELAAAFAAGANAAGADIVDAGLGSTDYLYYASGSLDLPGAMITASHNPARDNGIKLCRAGAAPIGESSGLGRIRSWLEADDIPGPAARPGTTTPQNLLGDYAAHLNALVPLKGNRRLTAVVDAGNGMAGHTVPAVFDGLPVDVDPLYFELDGSFPITRPIPWTRRTSSTFRPGSVPSAPTSASPSTETPTGASSSTSAARRCPPRPSSAWSPRVSWPVTPARPLYTT